MLIFYFIINGGIDMAAKIDITGQKFNRLVVLEDSKQRSASGSIKWKCQCDCGNITYATSTELRNGHKKSCGCLQKEKATEIGHNNRKDLTGKRFGNLIVVEYSHSQTLDSKNSIVFWKCRCDCGQELIVRSQSLVTGNTKSCGCIKSFGEQKIAKLLRSANINFVKEKIFDDFKSYRYDFYVDDYYIIEYDGKQHFTDFSWGNHFYKSEEVQIRDQIKNNYCYEHNIPIIRIPYTHYNDLNIKDLLIETSTFLI